MIKNICRICLNNNSLLYNMFAIFIMDNEGNNFSVSQMLSCYCSIKIDKEIPQSICANCINACTNTYNFIKLVQKNDRIFDQLSKEKGDFVVVEIKNEANIEIKDPLADTGPPISILNHKISTSQVEIDEKEKETVADLIAESTEITKNASKSNLISQIHACPVCIVKIRYYSKFVEHLKLHPGEITCNLCPETCQNNIDFERHYFQDHYNYCDMCQVGFVTRKQYEYHRITAHKDFVKHRLNKRISNKLTGYRHICPICSSSIKFLSRFRLHIRNSHFDHDNALVNCAYCSAAFEKTDDFFNHYTSEHYMQCRDCKLFFTDKLILEAHNCRPRLRKKKQSSGKTRHVCPICGKNYLGSKRVHEELHQNTANYKCDMCESTFIGYDQLRYHRLKKHNLMKHLCSVCGERFVSKTKLTVHMSKHTGVKAHSCKDCGRGFVRADGLRNHQIKQSCGKRKKVFINIENAK